MSADRYEITVTDILARVEYPNGCTAEFFADTSARDRFAFAAIRQQARDLEQLRADLAAAVAERDKLRAIDCGWIAGQPPRYIGEEWFIAKTIHSERVVLRALGDGHSYDYTTADGTYMRAKNIVKWMQFPDSQYKSAAIAEITVRAEQAEARLARNTCEHCDGTGDVHTPTGEWVGECDCVYAQNNKLRAFKSAVEAAPAPHSATPHRPAPASAIPPKRGSRHLA